MDSNFEKIKRKLLDRIMCIQTPAELYEFFWDEIPFEDIRWDCAICTQHFEACTDDVRTNERCIARFCEWCRRVEQC